MSNYETVPDRLHELYPERKHVRWDPTVNMGHVLSISASLIAAAVFAVGTYIVVNTRIIVLEQAKDYQAQRDLGQDTRFSELAKDLKEGMSELKTAVNELRRDTRK